MMEIFLHHIYEYKKGLRRMVLHTAPAQHRIKIVEKLTNLGIDFLIDNVNEAKINVFFGNPLCIEVIRSFGCLNLSMLTDEQDFILGTLLGYDTLVQCSRYLQRKDITGNVEQDNILRHMAPETWGVAHVN
jgi:hypothetical protein